MEEMKEGKECVCVCVCVGAGGTGRVGKVGMASYSMHVAGHDRCLQCAPYWD